ncbi:GTP-binding protein REM 1 isoform X1 [Ciconia boyciana]|uniref:GTP-binding protein REM 1 isoform X1 n=1 Tax=Ciconia boyciana TaxID=52775 RepID=UPI003B9E8C52
MTLNTQRGSRSPLRRRASTPLPRPGVPGAASRGEPCHPQLGHSASEPGGRAAAPRGSWSSDSSGSSGSWEPLYRVVLLGDPGVGKTSLVNLFAGVQERDLLEQRGEAAYKRTLSVDGEETTLLVMDAWEPEQRGEESWRRSQCLQVGNAYIIVYSITDRGSFESASELRIQLRHARQAEDIPIILVGNKTDLVRCREVSVEGERWWGGSGWWGPLGWPCTPGSLPSCSPCVCPLVPGRAVAAPHAAAPVPQRPGCQRGRAPSLPFPCRGPCLRRGVRLQVHRDVGGSAAQRGRALRGGGAADPPAPRGQGGPSVPRAWPEAQGEPHQESPALPRQAGGQEQQQSGPQSPLQVLPRPVRALRATAFPSLHTRRLGTLLSASSVAGGSAESPDRAGAMLRTWSCFNQR